MLFNKIEKNKVNEKTIHLRTDNKIAELIYKDAIKNNKSVNLTINEVMAKYYGIVLPQ